MFVVGIMVLIHDLLLILFLSPLGMTLIQELLVEADVTSDLFSACFNACSVFGLVSLLTLWQ